MWLNPTNPESFPPGLVDALADSWTPSIPTHDRDADPIEARLRSQMQADALQPLSSAESKPSSSVQSAEDWSKETLGEVTEFLCMNVGTPVLYDAIESHLSATRRPRLKIDWQPSSNTFGKSIAIASGAEPNTPAPRR